MSITGDPSTDELVPLATRLVWSVRKGDRADVAAVLAVADPAGLAVVLAAMVPDDMSPRDLMRWLVDPEEYGRLREDGIGSMAAMNLLRVRGAA